MRRMLLMVVCLTGGILLGVVNGQTPVPNGDFENWISYGGYSNPQFWDTPNQEISSIPFFGTTVVDRSTDHESGQYSAELESKHITFPPLDVPGFITLGNLTIDIVNLSFVVTGGAPLTDNPTHVKGFYKYLPKGGDSCLIAIGVFKTVGSHTDTIGSGYYSTKDTVNDWKPFIFYISYDTVCQPDTMNIFALSTAKDTVTPGTILFLDDISLDYTVGIGTDDPSRGIDIYQDKETRRIMVFFDFPHPETTVLRLYSMTGQCVAECPAETILKDSRILNYSDLTSGIYVLEILHNGKLYNKKFFIDR
jgi:hypothetical protein